MNNMDLEKVDSVNSVHLDNLKRELLDLQQVERLQMVLRIMINIESNLELLDRYTSMSLNKEANKSDLIEIIKGFKNYDGKTEKIVFPDLSKSENTYLIGVLCKLVKAKTLALVSNPVELEKIWQQFTLFFGQDGVREQEAIQIGDDLTVCTFLNLEKLSNKPSKGFELIIHKDKRERNADDDYDYTQMERSVFKGVLQLDLTETEDGIGSPMDEANKVL